MTPRKAHVIALIYRHPANNFTHFQKYLTHILNKLNHFKQEYILVGDYNIDLLKHQSISKVCKYLSAIHAKGCSSINKPTRITETSATLLDHMYTNMSTRTEEF